METKSTYQEFKSQSPRHQTIFVFSVLGLLVSISGLFWSFGDFVMTNMSILLFCNAFLLLKAGYIDPLQEENSKNLVSATATSAANAENQ